MKVFDPEHPFIKSVEVAICTLGGECFPALRERSRESIGAPWLPKLQYGLLYYDEDKDTWEQGETSEDEENLILAFQSDGATFIQPGDDDYVYLRTTLRSGDEIRELTEFFTATKVDTIGTSRDRKFDSSHRGQA